MGNIKINYLKNTRTYLVRCLAEQHESEMLIVLVGLGTPMEGLVERWLKQEAALDLDEHENTQILVMRH